VPAQNTAVPGGPDQPAKRFKRRESKGFGYVDTLSRAVIQGPPLSS